MEVYLEIKFIVGILYWAVNIFIRKLHLKNEPGDGWWLVPIWVLLPELCFLILIVGVIYDYMMQIDPYKLLKKL